MIAASNHFINIIKTSNNFSNEKKSSAILTLGTLASFFKIDQKEKLLEIVNLLLDEIKSSEDIIKKSAINSLTKIIYNISPDTHELTPKQQNEIKQLAIISIEEQASSNLIIEQINTLAKKYIDNNIVATVEEQSFINKNFAVMLFLLFGSGNNIIHIKLLKLIEKAEHYNTQQVLDIINHKLNYYINLEDKYRIIDIAKKAFGDNYNIQIILTSMLGKLKLLYQNSNEAKYDDILSILNNLEAFVKYIKDNNIDVKITRDSIIFGGNDVALGSGQNIEERLENAEKIFNALTINSNNKLVFKKQIILQSIFSELSSTHMDINPGQVFLSIVHESTNQNSIYNAFIIVEIVTVFGDVLIKKISISSESNVEYDLYSNSEQNVRQLVFGEPTENKKYYVKTIQLTKENLDNFLSLLNEEEFIFDEAKIFEPAVKWDFSNLISYTRSQFVNLKDYNPQIDGTEISHNSLIKYQGLEERMANLENNFRNLKTQLDSDMQKLNLNVGSIDKLVSSLQVKYNIEQPQQNFNEYQKAFYITFVHELVELHMAAMVVQTNLVANSQSGIVGSIGSVFSSVSKHVPIAGIAVDFLGILLSAIDSNMQAKVSENIANVVMDSNEMSSLAKELALFILVGKINKEQLKTGNYIEKLQEVIDSAQEIKATIFRKVAELIVNGLDNSGISEKSKGEEDARTIIKIITGFMATGKCELGLDWHDNLEKLKFFTQDSGIVTVDVGNTASAIKNSEQDQLQAIVNFDSPKLTRDMTKYSGQIVEEVLENVKTLLDAKNAIFNNLKENFKTSFMNALTYENGYASNQHILYLSKHNNDLKKGLIIQLAYLIKTQLIEFDSNNNIIVIKDIFMGDGSILPVILQKARKNLTAQKFLDLSSNSPNSNEFQVEYKSLKYCQSGGFSPEKKAKPEPLASIAEDDKQSFTITKSDIAYTGASLITSMNSLSSLNYLSKHYIPILPLIEKFHVYKAVTKYSNEISTFIHLTGGALLSYAASINPIYPITSSGIFYAKPYIYAYRDNLIYPIENEWIKFGSYIITDTVIYSAISLPFMTSVTPVAIGYLVLQGTSAGAINYFNTKQYHEVNKFSDLLAFASTTGTLGVCAKSIINQPNAGMAIIVGGSCINAAANTHYITKTATDAVIDIGKYLFSGEITNITDITS
ncbi:MAG: hypothetical protein AABY27_05655 [Pseudomonadota bacterium]